MVQLIKKGGLRERANRSKKYAGSENNIKTLDSHHYTSTTQQEHECVTTEDNSPSIRASKTSKPKD